MLVYLLMLESETDRSKFEQLYNRYRGLMFHVAMQILDNERDAEDAVHEAFLSILKHFDSVSEVQSPKTRAFVVVISERKAIDIVRKRRPVLELDERIAGVTIEMPDDTELKSALARLPARRRELLLLRYYLGYSTKEAAALLSMTDAAAQKELWRAKQDLQAALGEVE